MFQNEMHTDIDAEKNVAFSCKIFTAYNTHRKSPDFNVCFPAVKFFVK